MITRMSHFSIFVTDQEAALEFYTQKLGAVLKTDTYRDTYRWLTVVFPAFDDMEILLVPVEEGLLFDKDTAEQLSQLITKGTFGAGVFHTENIYATYVELKEKGVVFLEEPRAIELGIEALFEDNSGNWFSLLQRTRELGG